MEIIFLEKEHLNYANDLRNKYIEFIRQPYPHNFKDQLNWFENTKDLYWIIKKDYNFCGIIGLTNIDLINRKAELSLITRNYFEKEIADFALKYVLNYANTKLNLHKIFITAFEYDKKKNEYFNKKFNLEYEMIDNVFYNNKFYKEICYSIIKDK